MDEFFFQSSLQFSMYTHLLLTINNSLVGMYIKVSVKKINGFMFKYNNIFYCVSVFVISSLYHEKTIIELNDFKDQLKIKKLMSVVPILQNVLSSLTLSLMYFVI